MSTNTFGSDFPPTGPDVDRSMERLMLQQEYTPEELATLLDLPQTLIEHDAYTGKLKSFVVNHNVICIRREDAIAWLQDRA